jgi:hypothetical protein
MNDSDKRRAIVAVGDSVLTIFWYMLSDPVAPTATSAPASTNHRSASNDARGGGKQF